MNAVYQKAKNDALAALWTGTIKAILVRTVAGAGAGTNAVYTPDPNTHGYMVEIPSNGYCRPLGTPQGVGQTIGSLTTDGVGGARGASVTFPAVPAGDEIQAVVFYKDTGNEATDRIVAVIDDAPGLPFTPDGTTIPLNFPTTIFTL